MFFFLIFFCSNNVEALNLKNDHLYSVVTINKEKMGYFLAFIGAAIVLKILLLVSQLKFSIDKTLPHKFDIISKHFCFMLRLL